MKILITGVTRGLGRALAEEFAAQDHTIIGCGRSANALSELREALGRTGHRFDKVDVASDDQVRRWAEKLLSEQIVPGILINNAALMNEPAPLWEVPAAEFSSLIDVNITGVVNIIRHFVPAMVSRRSGVIVNLSSEWGRSVDRDVAPYCATKWAIEGLTKALAEELPSGMAAVPLSPGIINTDMLRTCFGESAKSYELPEEWSKRAAPFILKLSAKHNGKSLSVPGHILEASC